MSHLQRLREQLRDVGPVLPGSLDRFYNVCGKPGCRCKDKSNPQMHGPYYRLSYSLAGKNSSLFVKEEDARAVQEMVRGYRKLRALTMQVALATLESVRQDGVGPTLQQNQAKHPRGEDKLRQKSDTLKAAQGRIRDLTVSRDKWKQECVELREQNGNLQQRLERSEEKIRSMEDSAEREKKA